MMNKIFSAGPIALTTTTTANLLNPPTAAGGVNGGSSAQYIILRHIRIVNKTGSAATFSLYKGSSGANTAGTEIIGTALSVPANTAYDWQGMLRLDSSDYLVGGASANTTLVINFEGEIGVAG